MKALWIVAGAFFIVFVILAVLAPKDFRLESDTIVNRPVRDVFDSLKLLKSHDEWSAWSKKDPNLKKKFFGTDGTVGFKAVWDSPNPDVGTAEQEIVGLVEYREVNTVLHFKKPFEAEFASYLKLESIGKNQTKVTMGMADEMNFPLNVVSFVYNVVSGNQKNIALDMDESLADMKAVLEQ